MALPETAHSRLSSIALKGAFLDEIPAPLERRPRFATCRCSCLSASATATACSNSLDELRRRQRSSVVAHANRRLLFSRGPNSSLPLASSRGRSSKMLDSLPALARSASAATARVDNGSRSAKWPAELPSSSEPRCTPTYRLIAIIIEFQIADAGFARPPVASALKPRTTCAARPSRSPCSARPPHELRGAVLHA
jgi:hypothetical protein